jgi:hypothetical protein
VQIDQVLSYKMHNTNTKKKSTFEIRLDKYEHACTYLQENVLINKIHKALTSIQKCSAGCKNGKELTNDVAPKKTLRIP